MPKDKEKKSKVKPPKGTGMPTQKMPMHKGGPKMPPMRKGSDMDKMHKTQGGY